MLMKKIVLFAVACLLSLNVNAQAFKTLDQQTFKRSTEAFQAPMNVGSRRALAANQYLCGYYRTDDLAEYGLGVPSINEVCKAACVFSPDVYLAFSGFKVVGMRVGLCYSVSNFGVFIDKINEGTPEAFKEKSIGTGEKGWNTIMFDESEQFVLPSEGSFMVGFSYMQKKGSTNACYPLSLYEGSPVVGNFWFYGTLNGNQNWYNMGNSYGALSVQLIVEGELPDQKIILEAMKTEDYGKIGDKLTGALAVTSMGNNTVNTIGLNYYIDNVKVGNTTISKTINSSATQTIKLNIDIPSSISVGEHTITVEVATINGAAPVGEVINNNLTSSFVAYINSKDRQKQLIEHITSWTCTYCYHGYNILRQMEQQYNDIAWVAIHGNQSTQADPYFFETCDDIFNILGVSGFPCAAFNRCFIDELSEGEYSLAYGLGYDTDQYLTEIVTYLRNFIDLSASTPTFVTLDVQSSFDATSREMQVTVNGIGANSAAKLLDGYGINIYVTEAGLTGRQYSAGSWKNGYEHNNTLRAVLTSVNGDDITWNGDNFTFTKSYTVPSSYKEDNLSIVAFVAPHPGNLYNMTVNNCEKVQLNLTPSAIQTVSNDGHISETARYTLDGRRVTAPQRGINIVKMSDGSIRKIMKK